MKVEKILNYSEFKDKMSKIFPNLSDEKREEIFHLRVDFWKMIIDNFDKYFNK